MWKKPLIAVALIFFLFLTVNAIRDHSYLGVILVFNANAATQLLTWDLILSLSLVCIWLFRDSKQHGNAFLPFLAITLLFGVAGPLLYLLLRGKQRGLQWLSAAVLLASLLIWTWVGPGMADVRTVQAHAADAQSVQKGRQILQQTAESHGLAAWKRFETLQIEAVDRWQANSWWPIAEQELRFDLLLNTFTSRAVLHNGPAKGQVWGLQAWMPYRQQTELAPSIAVAKPAPEIEFYLPSLQYFAEMPFRLLEAPIVRYAGQRRHRGRDYDLVFVTWNQASPHREADQYQVWVDRASQRIGMVHYTVREARETAPRWLKHAMDALATGTIHFENYRLVEGVWLPFVHTVVLPQPQLTAYPLEKSYFHRFEIRDVSFDVIPVSDLKPLAEAGPSSGSKPVAQL